MNNLFTKCYPRIVDFGLYRKWIVPRVRSSYAGCCCTAATTTTTTIWRHESLLPPRQGNDHHEAALLFNSVTFLKQCIVRNNTEFFRLLTTTRNRCWKCNAVVTERDLVCLSCGCVQEPKQNLNNFEIFKEVPNFNVDVRNLTVKFRRLQTMLHPDKFATRSEKEQMYSSEQSSKVNRAYQVLYHPLERGLYLLELFGKPLLEGEVAMTNDFLEDVMDINEQLLESSSPETVEMIRHTNNAKLEVLYAELSQAFKEKNIDRARELLAKLKYIVNLDSQIKKKEEELGMSRDD